MIASAVEALRNSKLPVLLIHGDEDRFVPCVMSQDCQKAGPDQIQLLTVPCAGHGLSCCVGAKEYDRAVEAFCHKVL